MCSSASKAVFERNKKAFFPVLGFVFLCFMRPDIAQVMIVYRCLRSTSESTVELNYLGRPK